MNKKLVAYFSATGTTEQVAKRLAEAVQADVFEIQPAEKYSAPDLDWNNMQSRSTKEMHDKSYRPAIANKVENMEQYDVLYLGFPIWWFVAPTIINTFLEGYDLSGKTIVPFATSLGSDMGSTNEELLPSCDGAKLLFGEVLEADASVEELRTWANEIQS
ncbi:MAG: flavodoxin [Chloroflexi bacterium]|nr:flavodoxin [Chloroflexota bacterium]